MSRSRSLRLQYSLRAMAIFITLFMIWGGYHANRGWKQRAAETVLRRHDARIYYGTGRMPHGVADHAADAYGGLVYRLWGEAHIMGLEVRSKLDPDVVAALIALPQMDGLGIMPRAYSSLDMNQLLRGQKLEERMDLPAGAMQRILAHRDLKGLGLLTCSLDSDNCAAIATCESIESLYLLNCGLSEQSFAELLKLPRLRELNIAHCQVTGSELNSVAGSLSLDRIECLGTPVGKEFAAFVGRSPNVTSLRLRVVKIDNDFISKLGAHPSLGELECFGGNITDEAEASFVTMTSLKSLQLIKGSLSKEAVARVKASNPKLFVSQL